MRILFLTSRLPHPPLRGDRVRTGNFLRVLAREHSVRVLSFAENDEDLSNAESLRRIAEVEIVSLSRARSLLSMCLGMPTTVPFQVHYYRSRRMRRAVMRSLREEFDLVYVHLFRMAPFVLNRRGVRASFVGAARTVLDMTDAISTELELSLPLRSPLARPVYREELARVRRYEGAVAPVFDEVWTISEADRAEIMRLAPSARVEVVPNGVDESLFHLECGGAQGGPILFVGNLSIAHNIDAVEHLSVDIMPVVRAELAGTKARVVGHSLSNRVGRLDGANGLQVLGYVRDLTDAYAGASVFAAPLRFAAGVQNKIIEAMAAGLPVVTTPIGNRGLGARNEEEILVCEGPREFASAIVGLLQDSRKRASLGDRGREFVRQRFRWNRVVERADAIVSGESRS